MTAERETTATDRRLTPLMASRKKCLWCRLGSSKEVRLCSVTECGLHRYRLGKKPKAKTDDGMTTLRAIQEKCLDCSAGSSSRVRDCPMRDCALYTFREGKNPKRAGVGNIENIPLNARSAI